MPYLNVIFTLLLMVNLFTPIADAVTIQSNDDWITVDEAIALDNDGSTQKVRGYIVGYVTGPGNVSRDNFEEDYNFALASNPGETDIDRMVFIQLQGVARAEFGLKSNPENLDKEIFATGSLEKYFSHNGVKGVTEVEFVPEDNNDWISVEEALQIGSDNSTQTIRGYIVGEPTGKNTVLRDNFRNDHAVALADNPGELDVEKMIYVQLVNKNNFREDFGLKTNPENLDKEVFVTGSLQLYHQRDGVKDLVDMWFADDAGGTQPDPEPLEIIPIADAHAQGTGEVKVKGVVTAKLKNTIHIQDETGGIAVRPTTLDVQLGDEIVLQGNLQDFRTLLQVDGAVLLEKTGSPGVPEAIVLSAEELTKANQSKLARVQKVTIVDVNDGGTWANYGAVDENGVEFLVRDENNDLNLTVGTSYDAITGIVSHFDGDAQIIPRNNVDIIVDESVVQSVYARPDAGVVPSGTEVTLATNTPGARILYTLDDTDPSTNGIEYTEPIVLEESSTIRAIGVKDGLTPSGVSLFEYVVYDADAGIQIHDIQGEGHLSPMIGHLVSGVEGVVTYKYDIRGSHYFHIQSLEENYDGNPNTSEAIVVYTGRAEDVEVGDLVSITGTVDEYHIDGYDDRVNTDLSVTQINARNDRGGKIEILREDIELPAPIVITSSDIPADIISDLGFDEFDPKNYAIDFWESMEAMRVEIAPSKAVAPQEHGDLVVVTEEYETDTIHGGILLKESGPNAQSIQFKLHPNNNARDLAVKTGDKITESIVGVVNYGFSNYKVYADLADIKAALVEVETTTPRSTKIEKDLNKLSIAAYNVENFSANTSDRETPVQKAKDIARAFVEDMESPDIIGVVEVQDNNGQLEGPEDADASESYERLIRVIQEAGGPTYEYANIDPEYNADGGAPHGNIRVGFLYNPDRVSMIDAEHGRATDAVGYENGKLTLNPGRIDPNHSALERTRKPLAAQFEFKGETVVVVANHFNSKLGDYPYFGQVQPPILGSVEQRKEIAALVNNFVKDIMKDNPEENVVVLGDMNDFEFSEALDVLKGDELTNMVELVPEEERYTYVYQGNSQVLDHILVSNHLADQTEIDILHVNADFTDMHGRASDHDPLLAQIDLTKEEEPEVPGEPEEPGDPELPEEPETPTPEVPEEPETPGDGDSKGEDADEDGDKGGAIADEKDLPKTATNMYNLLFVGFILLIFGGIIFHAHRRHAV